MTYALFILYTLLIYFIGTRHGVFMERLKQRRGIVAVIRFRKKYWEAKSAINNN